MRTTPGGAAHQLRERHGDDQRTAVEDVLHPPGTAERDVPRFIQHYRDGQLPVEELLTHRMSLDEINAGFDRLARGEAVRQVVLF